MITGASWKPFAAVRSPVVPLKENVPPGLISVPSISRATSCTLLSRPGVPPYVVVYDETTPVMPIVRRDLGRARRLGDADGELGGAVVGRERRRRDRLRRRREVELEPGRRGPDHDLAGRRDLEPRVLRLAGDGSRRGARGTPRPPRPANETSVAPPAGSCEQGGDSPARHPPARLAVGEPERCADSAVRACSGRIRQVGGVNLRLGRRKRERDRARRDRIRREPRATTAAAAARSSSRPERPSTTFTARPVRTSFASTPLRSTARRDLAELVVDGGVVGMEHRRHVEPEEPRPEALEAAERPEAAAVGGSHPDGGAPVGLDAELRGREREALAAGGERDRRCSATAAVRAEQHPHGFGLGQPADVDPGHGRPGRERRTRAGEGEPDETCEQDDGSRQENGPAQGNPMGGSTLAHAGAVDRRVGAHRSGHSSAGARPGARYPR